MLFDMGADFVGAFSHLRKRLAIQLSVIYVIKRENCVTDRLPNYFNFVEQ